MITDTDRNYFFRVPSSVLRPRPLVLAPRRLGRLGRLGRVERLARHEFNVGRDTRVHSTREIRKRGNHRNKDERNFFVLRKPNELDIFRTKRTRKVLGYFANGNLVFRDRRKSVLLL